MIQLTNTPNLMGIELKGDYQDLNALYDAISKITDLYIEQSIENIDKQVKEGVITEEIASRGRSFYQEFSDCILGLNYDIRHAYQGDRGFSYEENGADNIGRMAECIYEVDGEVLEKEREKGKDGNVYFTVEILYPWAIYYLLNISAMIDGWYDTKLMKKMIFSYDEIEYRKDESILGHFVAEIWACIRQALGQKKGMLLYQLSEHCMGEADCHSLYGTALCNYYCDRGKKSKKLRKAMLFALILEMMGTDCLVDKNLAKHMERGLLDNCKKEYKLAITAIKEMTGQDFLFQEKFFAELEKFMDGKEGFSYEEREAFFDSFGDVDWDRMKW